MARIVDAQLHIWLPQSEDRPWPTEYASTPHGPVGVTPEPLLKEMDKAGVERAFLVPPSFEGDRNDYVLDSVTAHPDRFRAQGRFPIDDPKYGPAMVEALKDPRMLGMRITLNGQASTWLLDGTLDWLWPFAQEHDVHISLYPWAATATTDSGELAAVREIGLRYPDLKLNLDHYAVGQWVRSPEMAESIARLESIGRETNIALKTSALPTIIGERAYDPDNIVPIIEPLLEWFGPKRLFWGSDLTRSPEGYSDEVSAFAGAMSRIGASERDAVMGESILEWFGWE